MAFKFQASFSAGELDPALRKRTTLDKYRNGLGLLRNAYISKTGGIVSRSGGKYLGLPDAPTERVLIWSNPTSPYLIEWGEDYIRYFNPETGASGSDTHAYGAASLDLVQFSEATIENVIYVFVFCEGENVAYFDTVSYNFTTFPFVRPYEIYAGTGSATSGTGYPVEYQFTVEIGGQESSGVTNFVGDMVISSAEENLYVVDYRYPTAAATYFESRIEKLNAYRRPESGQAYGYIGSSYDVTYLANTPSVGIKTARFTFIDRGGGADYSHNPGRYYPEFVNETTSSTYFRFIEAPVGAFYQGRLVVGGQYTKSALYASRPGFANNMYRDFPIDADSALAFKSASDNNARNLRVTDIGKLAAFTTGGLYVSPSDILVADTAYMVKRGDWIIDKRLEPLKVPGALLVVEEGTNAVLALNYSTELSSFNGRNISIYSSHLFRGRRIVSWAYEPGDSPRVWVVLDNGHLLSLTIDQSEQMQAWAHHDTDGLYENVTVTRSDNGVYNVILLVNRDDNRVYEKFGPRFLAADDLDIYHNQLKGFVALDGAVTKCHAFHQTNSGVEFSLVGYDPESLGPFTLNASIAVFANTAGNGAAGTIFRTFDDDGMPIDFTVTAYTDTSNVVVEVDNSPVETPFTMLFKTYDVVDGLGHLEGKEVAMLRDGFVDASPKNRLTEYPTLVVTGGQVTIPDGKRGAITHVGLPVIVDWGTLDIDTIEQKPTTMESLLVNKVYVEVHESRGFYVGGKLKKDDTNRGLEDIELRSEDVDEDDDELPTIANAPQAPYSKELEVTIENSWSSNGRVFGRQVDPLGFEILSVTPDAEINWR